MERFQQAADAQGRLLSVAGESADAKSSSAAAFLLTFDVGRLLVRADAASGDVASVHLETSEGLQGDWSELAQEEPWWRLVGNPIVRVWRADPDAGGGGLRVQFREDEENPRVIGIVAEGKSVRAFLDSDESLAR
jgi:hypothetical protein